MNLNSNNLNSTTTFRTKTDVPSHSILPFGFYFLEAITFNLVLLAATSSIYFQISVISWFFILNIFY